MHYQNQQSKKGLNQVPGPLKTRPNSAGLYTNTTQTMNQLQQIHCYGKQHIVYPAYTIYSHLYTTIVACCVPSLYNMLPLLYYHSSIIVYPANTICSRYHTSKEAYCVSCPTITLPKKYIVCPAYTICSVHYTTKEACFVFFLHNILPS